MNIHKNAKLTPLGRERMVLAMRGGQTPEAAARDAGVCPRTALKWLHRYEREGRAGLADRSSRPKLVHRATPPETVEQVIALRNTRIPGKEVARRLGLSPATVSRILRKVKLSRTADLDPPAPPNRYEHPKPGAMIHIDIKKLGRIDGIGHRITGDRRRQSNLRGRGQGLGWEFAHVAIDDNSRLAFSQIKANEKAVCAIAFRKAAVAYYRSLGVTVERVMTDNGLCYKARAFAMACLRLRIKHVRTRPYTPRTNGKAERFIQTALREWAYAKAYQNSKQRQADLPTWLHRYNCHRPHSSIGDMSTISRLDLTPDNLLRVHI